MVAYSSRAVMFPPGRARRRQDPCNGIALCKNAHWLFDNGLWTLSDEQQVLAAIGRFAEASPDQKSLAAYHRLKICLPSEPTLWPGPEYLDWHRRKKFLGE